MRVKRKLFLTTAFAALLGVGAFAGVLLSKEVAKPAEAASENWYYRGNGKGMSWGDGSDSYVLHNVDFDASGTNWSFNLNEEFKFTNSKSGWSEYGVNSFGGTAGAFFEKLSNSNLKCNLAGVYNVSLYNGSFIADFADNTEFYYVGSDTTKTTAWTNYTAKPIKLNGSAVQLNFKANEQFKIRHTANWDSTVRGFSDLKDNDTFYGSFEAGSDGNIKCKLCQKEITNNIKFYCESCNYIFCINCFLLSKSISTHQQDLSFANPIPRQ